MTDAPELFPDDADDHVERATNDSAVWDVRVGDPNLVVPTQPAIWVYNNPNGAVVIRMESVDGIEDDSFVFIRPENVDAVVAQMLRVKADLLS